MREKEELLEKNEIAEAEAADVATVENHCDNPDDAPAEAGQSEDCENVEKSEEGASSENDAFKNFAAEPVQPPKKKKYGWLSTVLLLVAIGLGIWAMFGITHEVADAETTPIWTLKQLGVRVGMRRGAVGYSCFRLDEVCCYFEGDYGQIQPAYQP